MLKTQKPNKPVQRETAPALKKVRKSVYKQALLAGLMIVLTVVILFAMTAAWYTNIAQTNGLVFRVSEWGFQGSITLGSDPIKAAPGEDGVLSLTAVSKSTEPTAVGISISKNGMDDIMSQRLYFYVDGTETRSGEIMDRVYLNSLSSYTYTMFSEGSLILTEEYHNDALLKWQWVYDVLGYYVVGVWNESAGTMAVEEYLRPIEYNYNEATTIFDTDGNLVSFKTSSGATVTVEEFLEELFATDGYPGPAVGQTIAANSGGYYPVMDLGDGTGIYAYLCNRAEIQENGRIDTALGEDAANGVLSTWRAQVTISAQNIENAIAAEISTPAQLAAAIEGADRGESVMLRLASDVTLGQVLNLDNMQDVYLDLNGHNLNVASGVYSGAEKGGIRALPGSSVTLVDGNLTGTSGEGVAIYSSGAEVTLSGVNISGVGCALYVRDDQNSESADSLIRIVDSYITTGADEGIYLSGNGSASAQKTQLVVEDTQIISGYIGIMGNGNDTQWGTDVQIINSSVSGYYAGIYQPQRESTLVVTGQSNISGETGIVLKGGSARILGGTVNGMMETAQPPVAFQNSGFCDTGDAIYIETNYGHEICLEVSNAVLTCADTTGNGLAVRVFEENSANVDVDIYSGNFCSDVSRYVAAGSVCTGSGNSWQVTAGISSVAVGDVSDTDEEADPGIDEPAEDHSGTDTSVEVSTDEEMTGEETTGETDEETAGETGETGEEITGETGEETTGETGEETTGETGEEITGETGEETTGETGEGPSDENSEPTT